jgi:hypothetical protein
MPTPRTTSHPSAAVMPRASLTRPILGALAIVAIAASAAPAALGRFESNLEPHHGRPQTLLLDASFTHVLGAGPDANHVGHKQIAGGVLRDSAGGALGRFAFSCTWTRILADGDALERCAGSGRTADGRLDVAGPSRASEATHSWRITGGSHAYRGAHGTVLVRDISDRESLMTATITLRAGVLLHVAVISRPDADTSFIAGADQICTRASRQLAALPPFPFANFDPLHPDPGLLPQVGKFFTGPGDPRPIFRTLNARLRTLGQPPAGRGWWSRMLRARTAELTVINEQDRAALASDVPSFVDSVQDSINAFRRVAITATVLGASQCVL